jgi:hypothetical protein
VRFVSFENLSHESSLFHSFKNTTTGNVHKSRDFFLSLSLSHTHMHTHTS